jgi:hypothetical protein
MRYTISVASAEPLVSNESLNEAMKESLGGAECLGLQRRQHD